MAKKKKFLRKKLSAKGKEAAQSQEAEQILEIALHELKQDIPATDGPKIVKRYPREKCSEEDCKNYAVGSSDKCRGHGGDPLIRENLLSATEVTALMEAGSIFDARVHPIAYIECSREGMSEVEIAAEFGVSVYMLRNWNEKYLEFNTAYEIGNAMHEAWWLQEGKENLDNRSYNVPLYKYITMNKIGYSDKIESKSLHVHAGVLQVPAKMDAGDWEQAVKQATEKKDDDS